MLLVGIRHIRRVAKGRNIVRGCRLDDGGGEKFDEHLRKKTWSDGNKPTANLDRGLQFEQNGLVDENFPCFCTQVFDFVLCQLDWLSGAVATHCGNTTKGC